MRHAVTLLVFLALPGCSAEEQDNISARQVSAEEQFQQKYPMRYVKGLTARIGPAPFGDELSVAEKAITVSEHPCAKVDKAVRNEADGSVTAKCSNGERYNVITVESIADPVVMRCSALEKLIQSRLETCHTL